MNGENAQADALHAANVDRAGHEFGECRQASWVAVTRGELKAASQIRLLAAVERGQRMPNASARALVFVVLGKTRRPNAGECAWGPPRPGNEGSDRLQLDIVMDKKCADALLQFVAQQFGRDTVFGIVADDLAIELVCERDKMSRSVDITDVAPRQAISGTPEQGIECSCPLAYRPHRAIGPICQDCAVRRR